MLSIQTKVNDTLYFPIGLLPRQFLYIVRIFSAYDYLFLYCTYARLSKSKVTSQTIHQACPSQNILNFEKYFSNTLLSLHIDTCNAV